ncbi:hypothetical protein ACFPZ0_23535 [Streptomonospora nanhaiensis]|uniref:DUF3558 domain-containing protein n=1 Tax=Streptomonospora nanhaiensis TaxID=1323731 RepID=A0A853BWM1_9ACTN|nr:hypothetical protein [Streptomonospora nanhaiensis]MBV2363567.1 hypothetical protein [Streptomonospora nanhaiensis]MBX9390999.1 hypothetical protein [Streptomonospora nanhaiensis]NYI98582.1 hypothetical protein [Streptomonospora nanhaiensis]
MSSAPAQSRGCATAVVATLGVIVLLMAIGGVWAIVALTSGGGGDYDTVPDCAAAQTDALESLVPDRRSELDQPIEGFQQDWREGRECRWATDRSAESVPAAARVVFVRYDDHNGTEGTAAAADAMDAAAGPHSTEPVADLGDEAVSWHEETRGFGWGCVAVRMSNLYTLTCYTASIDYQSSEAVPAEETVAGAEELARAVAAAVEEGDY